MAEARIAAAPPPTAAGLWPRALAFAADYLILAAYLAALVGLGLLVGQFAPGVVAALFSSAFTGQLTGFALITLPVTLYFALAEASPRQATWGKGRLWLRVQTAGGARLSLPRALARTALKFTPWELAHTCIWQISFAADPASPLYTAGFALVWVLVAANIVSLLLSPRRQTLYDHLSRTGVVRTP